MKKPRAHFRTLRVPGGSDWHCSICSRKLQAGEKVAKLGSLIYCDACIQGGKK